MRQGFVMPGFLSISVIDWIIRSTNDRKWGIRVKFMSTLEYFDYADDLALISSKYIATYKRKPPGLKMSQHIKN